MANRTWPFGASVIGKLGEHVADKPALVPVEPLEILARQFHHRPAHLLRCRRTDILLGHVSHRAIVDPLAESVS